MSDPGDPIRSKSNILASIRNTLFDNDFLEVITPVIRRTDLGAGRRIPIGARGDGYLRAMIGPALRVNLDCHPRVFEIGPCFRPEKLDDLHAPEFTMLDLYAAGESFEFLLDLAEQLVTPHIPYTPVRVSVADYIDDVFGVDLRRQPIGNLPTLMADYLQASDGTPFKDVLGRFIERDLESRSIGAAVFLTDYPLGGDEPCAKLTPGTLAVLNRFELIVDGIEVVHGYEDESDGSAFAQRALAVGLYDQEQQLVWDAIDAGHLTGASVGLGIGIERLCAAGAGIRDIRPFRQSAQF